jgi:signal transduction histidine kinase
MLDCFENKFYVVKISDYTLNIQYDLNLGEKRLLELVNACVSHEMRNPINAILGMNLKLKDLTSEMFEFIFRHLQTNQE